MVVGVMVMRDYYGKRSQFNPCVLCVSGHMRSVGR